MAFVFRSEQNKEKPIKTEDILLTNEKIEKEYIENKYTKIYKENLINNHKLNSNLNLAFSSSSKKEPSYYYPEKNPGPGAYDPQPIKQKQSLENTDEDLLDSTYNNAKNTKNNKLFISKETRFKKNQYTNDLPGPGKYYKDSMLNQSENYYPRRQSGILYKKSQQYSINSAKRKVTIPSKGTNFGYSINKQGDININKDPHKINKFNGTKRNSVGPGYYSIENSYSKINNAHDWNKDMGENNKNSNKQNNKNNNIKENGSAQTEQNNLEDYYIDSPPYSVSSLNSIVYNEINNNNKIKKERKIKNIISKRNDAFPNIPIKYSFDEEYSSGSKQKLVKRSYIKESNSPGPGKYKIFDEFDIIANSKKNQNFGSKQNRGLLFSIKNNIIKVGNSNYNNIYRSFINSTEENIIKNDNKNISKENIHRSMDNKGRSESINNLIKLKIQGIKDDYINNKNAINSRLGPGTYSPDVPKKLFSKEIHPFGSLTKRFDSKPNINSNNDNKPNSLLIIPEDYKEKKDKKENEKINFKLQIPKNILERNVNGISFPNYEKNRIKIINENRKSPPIGYYSPEQKLSIEHEAKMLMNYNERSPGFGKLEKRFYEKENKENENLGAGSYNIITPYQKPMQRKIPFIFGLEKGGRGSMLDNHFINHSNKLGPGAYKYDDKNGWNKKSFNKLFS